MTYAAGMKLVLAVVTAMVIVLGVALGLVAWPPPQKPAPADVFGFEKLRGQTPDTLAPLRRYIARDGEALAYRLYESSADRILIFLHGSSYHGASYHQLAVALSARGAAKVVLPNLRGHYMSGSRRGDIDYIGQYEDDIDDLIAALAKEGVRGSVAIAGHSSGGGLTIRYCGRRPAITACLALAPILPGSPAIRGQDSGGWSTIHLKRIIGLAILGTVGIHGFDALPVIEFNKPAELRDGTETLAYSYRLNVSYHPDIRYKGEIAKLPRGALILVGEADQAVDAAALTQIFREHAPQVSVETLAGVDHFGVFNSEAAIDKMAAWLERNK